MPPFVPHRAVAEQVFAGPNFDEAVIRPPLHIECTSELALTRRIADVDKEAAFVWFSSESEVQKRGSIMVYLPIASGPTTSRRCERRRTGAFYIGFSQHESGWEPAMLRGVSRREVEHLEECGRALIGNPFSAANQQTMAGSLRIEILGLYSLINHGELFQRTGHRVCSWPSA